MIFNVINNNNPRPVGHRVIVNVLFNLRQHYQITIHACTSSFYHIKKDGKVIGFACDQLMAIDKAFSFIGTQPPVILKGMIEKRYWQIKEQKAVIYG